MTDDADTTLNIFELNASGRQRVLTKLPRLVRVALAMVWAAARREFVLNAAAQAVGAVALAGQVLVSRELLEALLRVEDTGFSEVVPWLIVLALLNAVVAFANLARVEQQVIMGELVSRHAMDKVLRVATSPEVARARADGWLDRALPQIGSMTSRLVRSEDTAGRLAPEVFALALPATRTGEARIAAERIAAVIGCTAFDAGPDQPPFVLNFDLGIAELLPGEPPAGLLERASAELTRIDGG